MTAKPTKSKNQVLWSTLKKQLSKYSTVALLELISDLHSLSADNKRFIEAKVINNQDTLKKYKDIISKSISTDAPWKKSQQLSLKTAKKAISDYKKVSIKKKIRFLDIAALLMDIIIPNF